MCSDLKNTKKAKKLFQGSKNVFSKTITKPNQNRKNGYLKNR